VYAKSIINLPQLYAPLSSEAVKQYKLHDEKGLYREKDFIFKNSSTNVNQMYAIECPNGDFVKPKNGYIYRFIRKTFDEALKDNLVVFKKTNNGPLVNLDGTQASWNIYTKKYLGDGKGAPTTNLPRDTVGIYNNGTGSIQTLFNGFRVFQNVKSVGLIKYLIEIFADQNNDIVLDFFSGSATTAHAVMQLNSEDAGNRKFICVQLPETTEEKSEAFKAGYKNICEIGKERIRRAGDKIIADNPNKDLSGLDTGFKVFKIS
jgi:adenine-specific DNA-methyltransferase